MIDGNYIFGSQQNSNNALYDNVIVQLKTVMINVHRPGYFWRKSELTLGLSIMSYQRVQGSTEYFNSFR